MNYDPAELAALLSEPWSNGSCRGYIIMAMENCGFADQDIRRIIVSQCGARQEGGTVPVPSSCVSPQDRWEAVY